jgi:hypothetical protein
MKVRIDKDQWYPVYFLSRYICGREIEVDAATVERWRAAFKKG